MQFIPEFNCERITKVGKTLAKVSGKIKVQSFLNHDAVEKEMCTNNPTDNESTNEMCTPSVYNNIPPSTNCYQKQIQTANPAVHLDYFKLVKRYKLRKQTLRL